MAMATTVQVLCPNGRRQNVKINVNTTMLKILEDVCKKQGFMPPSDYNLIHGRRVLDLTLSFRFSNLPNNVKLEMNKAEQSREITNVHIALSVPSGERHEHDFPPSTCLWDLLMYWDDKLQRPFESHFARINTTPPITLHPVCIHLHEEVVGQYALQNTTLHHLGLTTGRALIRLTYRPVEESAMNDIHKAVDQRLKYESRLEREASRHSHASPSNVGHTPQASYSYLEPISTVIVDPPDVDMCETISIQNLDDNKPPGSDCSIQLMDSIPDFSNYPPREQEIATRLAQRIMPHIGMNSMTSLGHATPSTSTHQPNFADFKFPEETKGKDLYRNEHQDFQREDYLPCERETVVYCLDAVESSIRADLPDDFFDVTKNDVQYMMEDQQKQLRLMANQPLMTHSMREIDRDHKSDKYKFSVIRVHFPDKYVLQGKFRKYENLYSLYKFVKEHLADKEHEFYLYSTPPKVIHKDFALSLVQANLVPRARIYFGCKQPRDQYLSADTMLKVTAPDRAFSFASLSVTSVEEIYSPSAVSQNAETVAKRPRKDAGVVPKWFTAGKK